MNVTFLIGNGFDLHLGMKTRYVDVYDEYIKEPSKNENIKYFKGLLKNDKPNKYSNWSDFEIAMGQNAKEFKTEQDYIECIRDFKLFMAKYLEIENKEFENNYYSDQTIRNAFVTSFIKFVEDFYIHQTKNVVNKINAQWVNVSFKFINFNYTNSIDLLIRESHILRHKIYNEPVHIHGSLINGDNIVLGVDNDNQIDNKNFELTIKTKRAFNKPAFNIEANLDRFQTAKKIILDSDIVCVYGMSLGQSDKLWVDLIIEWLQSNKNNKLFKFYLDTGVHNDWLRDEIMDAEDEMKDKFFEEINCPKEIIDSIFSQVHIPIGHDVFSVVKINEKVKALEPKAG